MTLRLHGLPPTPIAARGCRHGAAFSLTELMVVIAIIGLINGLAIAIGGNGWQRERVNAVALGLAGWLEEVRGQSLRQISDNSAAGGCVVTVNTLSQAAVSAALVTVTPSDCASTPTLLIPGVTNSGDRYDIATNAATIVFTPRGSVTSTTDTVMKVFLRGSSQLRCVRVSALLGLVRVGSNSTASAVTDSCTDYTRF